MNRDLHITKKRLANWLGNGKRIMMQLLVSGYSHLTLPFVNYRKNATLEYFSAVYNGRPDPLIFDGKDFRYIEQIQMIYKIENFNNEAILDLGCGNGSFFFWLKMNNIFPASYTGIDFGCIGKELQKNARITREDISDLEVQKLKATVTVVINTLCYLDTKTVKKIFMPHSKEMKLILIDPMPGLFWDAHFNGVKLYYRKPLDVVEMLRAYGWDVGEISIDYGVEVAGKFFLPLSYCLIARFSGGKA